MAGVRIHSRHQALLNPNDGNRQKKRFIFFFHIPEEYSIEKPYLDFLTDPIDSQHVKMNLSEQQHQAIEYEGSPTLVIAGAGSGKTRTLTAKISHLVARGALPERILAITFTNKAAEEMKARLVSATGRPAGDFPWVRTFHSACYKILRVHCALLGYSPPLQIYDTYHQQNLLREIVVGKMNYDKKKVPEIQAILSNAKNSGDPLTYLDKRARSSRLRLHDVYELYEEALKSKNAVDFDNILMMTRNLLRDHREIRDHYQNFFQYLLCDEYQDTNNLQEELTGYLLKDGQLFCVGDDWQAIYSFRGSNVNHFMSFPQKYKGARVFRLERNYRSADEIVQVANTLIDFNEDKMDKKCFSESQGGRIEIQHFFDDREEADWVARKIRTLHDMDIPYHQMAILYRTKFSSLSFEQALRKHSIPYQILGGVGFFERKEILDINSYLTASVFPKDDIAFLRIINTPKRGIGPGAVNKIAQYRKEDIGLQDAARMALREMLLPKKQHAGLTETLKLLDDIRDLKPDLAIETVIERIRYMEHLKEYVQAGSMDFTSRQENLEQLIFTAAQKDTILEYLEEAALVREDTEGDPDKGSGVNLLTVHTAKGLEFFAVFVVACEEQLFPHWRCMESDQGLQEERRLMYVAITRSEKFLFLTSANFRKGQFNERSRFLEELSSAMKE
jgi:DNA helicase-2/ATP-dependent DNA helicase PcrA